jgi:hypothetical protein
MNGETRRKRQRPFKRGSRNVSYGAYRDRTGGLRLAKLTRRGWTKRWKYARKTRPVRRPWTPHSAGFSFPVLTTN